MCRTKRLGPRQQLLVKSGKAEKGATKSDDLVDTGYLQCTSFKLQKTNLNNIHSRESRLKTAFQVFSITFISCQNKSPEWVVENPLERN